MYPSAGEVFYLRTILLHSSPRIFVCAKMVNGKLFPTYQEACQAMGLLHRGEEHVLCFEEAVQRCLDPAQLRSLLLLLTSDGAPAKELFDKYARELSADFRATMSKEAARNAALEYFFAGLTHAGKNPADYGLPMPSNRLTELEAEHARWNSDQCNTFLADNLGKLYDEQAQGYLNIVAAINGATANTTSWYMGKLAQGKRFYYNSCWPVYVQSTMWRWRRLLLPWQH